MSIHNSEGKELMSFPLTIGVVGSVFAPVLAAIGALAALIGDCMPCKPGTGFPIKFHELLGIYVVVGLKSAFRAFQNGYFCIHLNFIARMGHLFYGTKTTTTSKIVLVRVEIPNPRDEYKPGMQAWITLKSKARQTVAVPSNALLQGKDGAVVWVQNALGAFENRMVHTGVSNRDFTEITHGLTAG